MKVYLQKENRVLVFVEKDWGKIYDSAPTGYFEGVDLYAGDAEDKLRELFSGLEKSGELNSFWEIGILEEEFTQELQDEMEEFGVLVYGEEA